VIWAHAFSGVGAQEVSGVAFLRDGSLLVQAANDPMATAGTQLPSGAAFVAALDRNGKLLFSEPIRSSQVKPGNVVMTSQGNVVVTGTFGFDLDYSDLHLNWRDGLRDGGLALGNGTVADGAFGAFLLELAP
jgi:hypothetical protein